MEKSNKRNQDSNYHNDTYGYNSGVALEEQQSRTIKDYLFMVREKIWWSILIFFVVLIGTLVFTFRKTPLYDASARVRLMRDASTAIGDSVGSAANERIGNQEDFNTLLNVLNSTSILNRVENRIRDEEGLMLKIIAPYQDGLNFSRPKLLAEILMENRSILPVRGSFIVDIGFRHTDPEIAAKVANFFADEFYKSSLDSAVKELVRSSEDLKVQVENQSLKVKELELKTIQYRETHNRVAVDRSDDIDREELSRLKQEATASWKEYDSAKTEWDMIQAYKEKGQDLWDIDTIAIIPNVERLLSQWTAQKIEYSTLGKRYKDKHPKMIAVKQSLDQTQFELNLAVESAIEKVKSRHFRSETAYRLAQERLEQKEKESLETGRLRVEYNNILNDLSIARDLLKLLTEKLNKVQTEIPLKPSSVEIISRAVAPNHYSSPNELLYIAVGMLGGLFLGLGTSLGLALMDDRVKNLFDVESFIGIPILGVVPLVSRLTTEERARAVSTDANQYLKEAFRGIHSAMKLSETAKNAKVIIVTSTIPGEGKSFISSNLAQVYGIHGEKTLLIDCDLRMPKLAETLSFENKKGVLQFIEGVDEEPFMHKEVFPNVDVILTGGSTRSASESLSHPKFSEFLSRTKNNYDKIILDSPPAGVVSDTYSVSKEVDVVLYVIKFNTVKRRSALYCVKKFKEANIAVAGAILNGIKSNLVGYYYHSYSYDKAYTKYYRPKDS